MLSVLVFDAEEPVGLTLTLSSLVSGVVEGVLRDVVVVAPRGEAALKVADHAGCTIRTREEIQAAPGSLKGDWVLVLRAGDRLPARWPERAAHHVEDQVLAKRPRAGRFLLSSGSTSGWRRLLRRRASALLVPKTYLMTRLSDGVTLADAAKGMGCDRLVDRDG